MEGDLKIVNFEQYCPKCVHSDEEEMSKACRECVAIAARPDSHKPEKFIAKEGSDNVRSSKT